VVKFGTPPKNFRINGELIARSSDYFKRALQSSWDKGQRKVVNLPDNNAETFNIYLNWLHGKKLFVDSQQDTTQENTRRWQRMIDVYCSGDKLGGIDFKDVVIDAMTTALLIDTSGNAHQYLPHPPRPAWIYARTTADAKARQLLVHHFARANVAHLINADDHPEFLLDLSKESLTKDWESTPDAAARCKFHEHRLGADNCYRQKRR